MFILGLDSEWMLGLTSLEVYNSVFIPTEEMFKFELSIFPKSRKGGISYEKVSNETEKDSKISDITHTDIQDEIPSS